jgi:hypothetical protein
MTSCIPSLSTSSFPSRAGAARLLLLVALSSSLLLLLGRTVGAEREVGSGIVGAALHDASEDNNSNNKRRYLPSFSRSISDDTTGAALSSGNPVVAGGCAGLTSCVNGCPSHLYKIAGGIGSMEAATCGSNHQIYVWKGSGSLCSTFTCEGACLMGSLID